MPQKRGELTEAQKERIAKAETALEKAKRARELAVAGALKEGASIREIAAFTGMSTRTVQDIGRRNGWPTAEQRRRREAAKQDREAWRRWLDGGSEPPRTRDRG